MKTGTHAHTHTHTLLAKRGKEYPHLKKNLSSATLPNADQIAALSSFYGQMQEEASLATKAVPPRRRHMTLDAGTGHRPGPSPTAWGSNLTKIIDDLIDTPLCHYLPPLSLLGLMLRESESSQRLLSSGTEAMLLGVHFGGGGQMSTQAAWAPSEFLGISYGTAGWGGTVKCPSGL